MFFMRSLFPPSFFITVLDAKLLLSETSAGLDVVGPKCKGPKAITSVL